MYPYGFSFIIPAYNEEANIIECIASIQAELDRHPDIPAEIIVIDNNSTDKTAELARGMGVTVLKEERKGVVFARQAGSDAARYLFLANIDADNRVPTGWLDVANDLTRTNYVAWSGPLRYYGASKVVDVGGDIFYFLARLAHKIVGPTLQGGNYVIRKDTLESMGGYDTSYEFYGEDTRTAVLAAEHGKIKLVPDMWIWSSARRLNQQGITKTVGLYTANYISTTLLNKKLSSKYKDFR